MVMNKTKDTMAMNKLTLAQLKELQNGFLVKAAQATDNKSLLDELRKTSNELSRITERILQPEKISVPYPLEFDSPNVLPISKNFVDSLNKVLIEVIGNIQKPTLVRCWEVHFTEVSEMLERAVEEYNTYWETNSVAHPKKQVIRIGKVDELTEGFLITKEVDVEESFTPKTKFFYGTLAEVVTALGFMPDCVASSAASFTDRIFWEYKPRYDNLDFVSSVEVFSEENAGKEEICNCEDIGVSHYSAFWRNLKEVFNKEFGNSIPISLICEKNMCFDVIEYSELSRGQKEREESKEESKEESNGKTVERIKIAETMGTTLEEENDNF